MMHINWQFLLATELGNPYKTETKPYKRTSRLCGTRQGITRPDKLASQSAHSGRQDYVYESTAEG